MISIVPLAFVAIVLSIVLPIPPALVDVFILLNITFAIVVFVTSLTIRSPLKLGTLPTILLLATFARLAINLASTRNILGEASAGEVIEFFGNVVIANNLPLGIIMFLMITLVQLIVISKGSERVAEVAARFSLDAMPGRQMSIDSDIRSGIIEISAGLRKRQELQEESRLYGALDGAMKFIKGDAIAGIVITIVNLIGGSIVGLIQGAGSIEEVLYNYASLTIGDGLAAQIPALLNSITAGIVVTRVSSAEGRAISEDIVTQLIQNRMVVTLFPVALTTLSLITDLPFVPCLLATLFILLWIFLHRLGERTTNQVTAPPLRFHVPEQIRIEVALSKRIADRTFENKLDSVALLKLIKHGIFNEYGVPLDSISVDLTVTKDLDAIIQIGLRGVRVCAEDFSIGEEGPLDQVILRNILERLSRYLPEIIDDSITRSMLDLIEERSSEVVSNTVPGLIPLSTLTQIIRELLKDGISCLNLSVIIQAIAEAAMRSRELDFLVDESRSALKREISEKLTSDGVVKCIVLDPRFILSVDGAVADSVTDRVNRYESIFSELERFSELPIIVSRAQRRELRDYLIARGIQAQVFCFDEIVGDLRVVAVIGRSPVELARSKDNRSELELSPYLAAVRH